MESSFISKGTNSVPEPGSDVIKNRIICSCFTFDYYKILSDKNINLLAGRKHFKGITSLIQHVSGR